MNFKKDDYNAMARARVRAFGEIAKALGPEHPVTVMMGTLSYGRHNWEQGPQGNLQSAIREMSALDGYFQCLNLWALSNDTKAQRVMLDRYPHGFKTAESFKAVKP